MKRAVVIGSGIAGLSAAAVLAQRGIDVTVLEKNAEPGGRLRNRHVQGFTFDMGPSWYWMPDVFETFYNRFGKTTSDLYDLKKLDPGFRIFFQHEILDVPSEKEGILEVFDWIEKGSGKKLEKLLKEAEEKYEIGMKKLVYRPSYSAFEFINKEVISSMPRMSLLSSMRTYIDRYVKDPRLKAVLEFPVLFLGGLPENTPALYSLMNHAQLTMGTWYPMGGMSMITKGLLEIATEQGVTIKTNETVKQILHKGKNAKEVITIDHTYPTDLLIGAADYVHTESLLHASIRNYSNDYWEKRTMAPSSLIFYIGVSKKINSLCHHNLFFDTDFDVHADEIYRTKKWPTDPQFYVCCPSKTDSSVAPEGMENLFVLVPVAPGLKDTPEIREYYKEKLISKIEKRTEKFREQIVTCESYCINDFVQDFNAYKGNAYGLANTLKQTAFMKPKMKNKNLDNMFYCGHLTTPGPGLPPSLISGEVAASEALKSLRL